MEIEKEVLDYIHDYIIIDDEDFALLNNDFAKKELNRLSKIAHLGLMGKLRRLARHDKLEHAYGTYWLCRQCMEKKPRLVRDVVPFRLAGLLHGIGHAPFSYDMEYAIAKLYQVHSPTHKWVDEVFSACCEFAEDPGVIKAAKRMKSYIDFGMLHRWFGAFKIAKSSASELNTEIGKKVVRILVDTELFAHRLLSELDKLDYIPRDILYLAIGRIDLNFPLLLNQFNKGQGEVLIRPNVSSIIESTSDCLCDQVYLGSEEKCLRQVLEKCIVREVMGGNHTVEELINLDSDDAMENELLRFESGGVDLEDSVKRIKAGTIKEIVSLVGDSVGSSLFDVEMDLVRTNRRGINKYHETKGIYVQCMPNPYYYGNVFAFDWSISGFLASVAYDFDSASPQNVITVLSRAEQWLPANLYGIEASFGKDALRLLSGFNIETHLDRYNDVMPQIIKQHLKTPEEEWKKELFNESWSLYEQAPQIFAIYEDEEISPINHFLEFPQRWNTAIVRKVLDECRNTFSSMQKRRKRKTKNHDDRKDRLLEYLTYLDVILRIGEKGYIGWVLPSVLFMKEDGKNFAEVDIVALYVEKEFKSPIKIKLLEVSTNKSLDNKEENRKKLRNVAYQINSRFGRKVNVIGFFNDEQIVPPYS